MKTGTAPIVVETNCERKVPQRQEKSPRVIQTNVLHKITVRLLEILLLDLNTNKWAKLY